jgi:peptide chain release factor 2
MRKIAERELNAVLDRSGIARRNMRIDVDPAVIDILLKEGFSRAYGARPLKRAVERLALLPIARQMVKMKKGGDEPLLRLLAVGDRIKVNIVQAEGSSIAEVAAKSVTVVDPVRGKKVRVTPERIAQQTATLRQQVQELEKACGQDGLRERKAVLLELAARPDFWDDARQAREVLGEIHRIERQVEAVERVARRIEDLERLLEHAREQKKAALLAQAADRLNEVRRHVDLVTYSVRCRGPLDRCDAFVWLSLVEPSPADDDAVGVLADMYAGWARSKGFEVTVVHEELFSPKITRELVLLVEGVSVFGILQGEEGIHELVCGRTKENEKLSRFVRVRVLPLVEDEAAEPQAELEIKRTPIKGEGQRVKRYRSQVTITHRPSLLTIEVRNHMEAAEAVQAAGDLLRAERHRRAADRAGENGQGGPAVVLEQAIRRYTLRPSQSVKDQRTGLRASGQANLWNGALDEFLHAHLALRTKVVPAPQPAEAASAERS